MRICHISCKNSKHFTDNSNKKRCFTQITMEGVSYDVEKLDEMKRGELQKLCKQHGIKANSKTSQLIVDLKEYAKTHSAQQPTKSKTPEPKTPNIDSFVTPFANNETNTCLEQGISSDCDMNDLSDNKQSNEQSFKEQIMKRLEEKVQETLKESKIPVLSSRNVTFTVGTDSPKRKSLSKQKEHPAFKKMDSIDVYLAKKRKRTQSMYANIKKAKVVASSARNIIADMKASHNTPARKSPPKKSRRGTYSVDKGDVKMPSSFSFGHLKSPQVKKPVFVPEKPKTPAGRKSMVAVSKAKENKSNILESRKSLAVTPFRCTSSNNTLNTTIGSSVNKKKFDLQASLSKPLNYKPHKGKLVKFPYLKHESKIPVRIAKQSAVTDHKVDVKNVKVTSRNERRQANRNNRADKRQNAMLARRGLAC